MYRVYEKVILKAPFAYARIRARKERLFIFRLKNIEDKEYPELINTLYRYGYLKRLEPKDIYNLEKIELLLWRNLEEEIYLLYSIIPKSAKPIIEIFVEKINIHNIKNFLRLKYSRRRELIKCFIPNPYLTFEDIEVLGKYTDISKAIRSIERKLENIKEYREFLKANIKSFDDLLKLEAKLDEKFLRRFYNLKIAKRFGRVLIDKFNIMNKILNINIFIEGGFLKKEDLPNRLPWKKKPAINYYPFLQSVRSLIELDKSFDEELLRLAKLNLHKPWYTIYPFISYVLLKELEIKFLINKVIEKYYSYFYKK